MVSNAVYAGRKKWFLFIFQSEIEDKENIFPIILQFLHGLELKSSPLPAWERGLIFDKQILKILLTEI